MGKGEDGSAEQSDSENQNPTEEKAESSNETPKEPENKNEEKTEKKKDVEELRKVIKVDDNNEGEKQQPESKDEADVDLEGSDRDTLEQKRAILQSIKDFDFQIKKNQEDLTSVNKKLDSVSKDLDDLVSLYEIVSEQMNPFVGLSKVTKKRIDALENFTREIEDLKNRMGDLESFAEKTGANIKDIAKIRAAAEKDQKKPGPKTESDTDKKTITTPSSREISTVPTPPTPEKLAPDDIDKIIEQSFSVLNMDNSIDMTIDEFIESLLDMNIN